MTIKEAANLTGISIDTLRYYEKIGLIPNIPRKKSGVRDYDEHSIQWIKFILKFKESGASLNAIIKYIKLLNSENDTQEMRRDILLEIKKELDEKIEKLKNCSNLIEYKIKNHHNLCDPIMQELIKGDYK